MFGLYRLDQRTIWWDFPNYYFLELFFDHYSKDRDLSGTNFDIRFFLLLLPDTLDFSLSLLNQSYFLTLFHTLPIVVLLSLSLSISLFQIFHTLTHSPTHTHYMYIFIYTSYVKYFFLTVTLSICDFLCSSLSLFSYYLYFRSLSFCILISLFSHLHFLPLMLSFCHFFCSFFSTILVQPRQLLFLPFHSTNQASFGACKWNRRDKRRRRMILWLFFFNLFFYYLVFSFLTLEGAF